MANEIRNQYIITYSPINQTLDGSFRTIKVVANGPGRPIVRTRSGYYATPESAQEVGCRFAVIRFLWKASRGYRLTPWRSPYLALAHRDILRLARRSRLTSATFWRFVWQNRRELVRFLHWTERMRG